LAEQAGRLKTDRTALGFRIIHKMRKYEDLEYCLWVWEMWQQVKNTGVLVLEKETAYAKAQRASEQQQMIQTAKQIPMMARRMDILKRQMCEEKTSADLHVRSMTVEYAGIIVVMWEKMFNQRKNEIHTLGRLHILDVEAKDERIAVLERDIAEDKHIQSLKGMVVDLECRLKKALDRRKPKGMIIPPAKGVKCMMCSREIMHRNWKDFPTPKVASFSPAASPMAHSQSDVDLSDGAKNWRAGLEKKFAGEPAFAPQWRPS